MPSRIKPLFGIAGLLSLGIAPPWLAHARPCSSTALSIGRTTRRALPVSTIFPNKPSPESKS